MRTKEAHAVKMRKPMEYMKLRNVVCKESEGVAIWRYSQLVRCIRRDGGDNYDN